jgi:hypothetical protein
VLCAFVVQLDFSATSAPLREPPTKHIAAFSGPTAVGEKSFRLFLNIAKIASRTAKFLMDDQSFASPSSLFSV